jgi:predicted porin
LGEADLFSLSNLNAFYLKFALNPTDKVKVGAQYMRVWANKRDTVAGAYNLTVPTGMSTVVDQNALVNEYDLFADYQINKNVDLRATWAIVDPAHNVTLDSTGATGDSNVHRFFVTLDVKW